jgi:hypothetical protein
MAVLLIAIPLKPCLKEFYPICWSSTLYPIRRYAQSFKTNIAGFAILLNHTD